MRSTKQAGPVTTLFVTIIMATAGYFMAFHWGKPIFDQAKASQKWPQTEGVITRSKVQDKRSSDSTTYRADVSYTYTLDDQTYTSNTVFFGDEVSTSNSSHATKTVRKYPVGEPVSVYYNPQEPHIAVLETGATWRSYLIYGIGLLLLGGGLLGLSVTAVKIFIFIAAVGGLAAAFRGSKNITQQSERLTTQRARPEAPHQSGSAKRASQPNSDQAQDDGFDIQ